MFQIEEIGQHKETKALESTKHLIRIRIANRKNEIDKEVQAKRNEIYDSVNKKYLDIINKEVEMSKEFDDKWKTEEAYSEAIKEKTDRINNIKKLIEEKEAKIAELQRLIKEHKSRINEIANSKDEKEQKADRDRIDANKALDEKRIKVKQAYQPIWDIEIEGRINHIDKEAEIKIKESEKEVNESINEEYDKVILVPTVEIMPVVDRFVGYLSYSNREMRLVKIEATIKHNNLDIIIPIPYRAIKTINRALYTWDGTAYFERTEYAIIGLDKTDSEMYLLMANKGTNLFKLFITAEKEAMEKFKSRSGIYKMRYSSNTVIMLENENALNLININSMQFMSEDIKTKIKKEKLKSMVWS